MRVVIAGASDLAEAAAQKMIEAGHDVVIVDRDRERLEALAKVLDCGFIEGETTHPSTLREAAADTPDALLALTDSDENNVLCTVVGRSIGFRRVVPQIIDAELLSVCDELGFEDVLTPHETVAASLVSLLDDEAGGEGGVYLTSELRLMRVPVPKALDGATVADLPLGGRGRAIAVTHGEEDRLAEDSLRLHEGEELLLAVARSDLAALREALAGDEPG